MVVKRGIGFLVFLALVGSSVWIGLSSGGGDERRIERRIVYEVVGEQTRAEIFAFRALARNGLMDPVGRRTYNWTYEEDTTRTEMGWLVGFAASDCAPRGSSHTCRGLSGEDPALGNAISDTWLEVGLVDRHWEVLGIGGNITADDQRVVGFSLPDKREPSHWDFASLGLWDRSLLMTPIWVGPYPTSALGSVCSVASNGKTVDVFYVDAPNRPFEVGGWVRGSRLPRGLHSKPQVSCVQYAGGGWVVEAEPRLVEGVGDIQGVEATLSWHGDRRFTAPVECRASLVNENDEVIWEDFERRPGLWPPPDPADYPYEMEIFINAADGIAEASLKSFRCRTL